MLLLQFTNEHGGRLVGLLQDDQIRVIEGYNTTYALAQDAIRKKVSLAELVDATVGNTTHSYADVAAAGRVLPPLDHADEAHCYVTGTGLTHLGSAGARDAMHKKIGGDAESLSDSMKMFRLGVEGGKPADGTAGAQPEWFYKGDGSIVRASGQPLRMPDFALDGGEEPEIAGLYLIGDDGQPYRVGYAIGNEFSDHVTERQNYLYLAHSKLRMCSVGPALLVGELPAHIDGTS
ncbi:MAG: GguC family protein, partial [Janthinobacterium sp.]